MHTKQRLSAGDGTPGQVGPGTLCRRRRIPIIVAIVVLLVLTVAVGAYAIGVFHDDGRFAAEPPACATAAPSLHLLGGAYTTRQDENNNCDLLLPADSPVRSGGPVIIVGYAASTPARGDAPQAAQEELRRIGLDRPLPGVGDDAYRWGDKNVVFRVSNLIVSITVFPLAPATEQQVEAFAADLANRLRDG